MVAVQVPMIGVPLLQSQKILVAESQPLVLRPLVVQLKKLVADVYVCGKQEDLLALCDRHKPDILLLGTLPKFNSLDIYRQCRDRWQDLPVILLANQPVINDYFKNWSMKQGVRNVVSSYPQNFTEVRLAIEDVVNHFFDPPHQEDLGEPSTGSMALPKTMKIAKALAAMNEVSYYSKQYFGDLAIGNYWRKTRTQLLEACPSLELWQVSFWGEFENFTGESREETAQLTPEEFYSIKQWVQAFIKECERIVIDFSTILKKQAITKYTNQLLS